MTDVVTTLTGFAGALRAIGINADRARLTTSIEALHELDPGNADHVYWATKLALCSEPDDLAKFDAVFDLWFRGVRPPLPGPQPRGQVRHEQLHAVGGPDSLAQQLQRDD